MLLYLVVENSFPPTLRVIHSPLLHVLTPLPICESFIWEQCCDMS